MSALYFMNDAHFDPDAMMTFGVSAKSNADAIGYFGTGFKYAVAIILRLGGQITVESGGEIYTFATTTKTIRNKDFDIVTLNGANAGFTTHLGVNWEPWQAFRELWANCMDEQGTVSLTRDDSFTCITIDCPEISRAQL